MVNIKSIINRYRWVFNGFQVFGNKSPCPLLILVHITNECPCSCTMCYERGAPEFQRSGNSHMELPRFEKMLIQAKDFYRRPLIHLYGGEPLVHPQLPDFITLLNLHGFAATLNTNGEMLIDYGEKIANSPIRMVNVSLDGLRSTHDHIRNRPGLFDKAIDGMKRLRKLDNDIHMNINLVVNPDNVQDLFETICTFEDIFKGTRIDYFSIEHFAYTQKMLATAQKVDTDQLKRNLKRIGERRFAFPVSATPIVKNEDIKQYYYSREPFEKTNCNVPWIALNVFPNGDVTPGGGMFTCTKKLGNLENEILHKIWNGKLMKEFRTKIRKDMPEDCYRCCHTLHYSPVITCRTRG